MSSFGVKVKDTGIEDKLLSGPGQFLVGKLLLQMSRVKGFSDLFGPYKPRDDGNAKGTDQQRWADYARFDWSIRQLPAICVFESGAESKQSENAYLSGSIQVQVFWPPNMRRSDLSRVPVAFKSALENFFASKYISDMLDELYYIERDCKVPGLNELGKNLTWTPNVEGIVDSEAVPVTIFDISYRIDLRAWYRWLEFDDRTKEEPFERTLSDLAEIFGSYTGVVIEDGEDAKIQIPIEIDVENT